MQSVSWRDGKWQGNVVTLTSTFSSLNDGFTMCGVGLPEIVLNPLPFPFFSGLVLICGFTAVVVSAVSHGRKRTGEKRWD